jgi:spermidine synthase
VARRNQQHGADRAGDPGFDRGRPAILALFFLSGACGLVYEVVWMRMLTLVFGATAFATSTILASFFAGLALGSFLFGRLIDRGRQPLKVYAFLEAGVGAFAFLMPLLLAGLDDVYVALHRRYDLTFAQLTLLRFSFSFLVLLVPATFMGGTLPVLVKFFARRRENLGWNVAQLYAVNTFGAVVGTLSAGFFLILLLGLREATWLAGALNLLIAAGALALSRRPGALAEATARREEFPPPTAEVGAGYPARIARLALLTAAVSGFCGLSLEVLWTRALVFFLDNSTHAFSTMLTAFLLGIAIGSFIIARYIDSRKRLVAWLGATQVLIGFFAILAIPVLNHSTPVTQRMAEVSVDALLPWKWMGMRFVTSLSVMLIPTILMGMTFPLVIKIFTRSIAAAGKALGNVYAVNTVAGVAGSLAAGFVLIPLAGVQNGIILIAAVNAAMGVALLLSDPLATVRRRQVAALVPGAAFAGMAAYYLTAGAAPLTSYYERLESVEVLSYHEGVGSTVKVFRDRRGDKFLSIDGFPVAGTSPGMQDAQKSLAHVPMLLAPVTSPRVNIIGFGSGGTSSAIFRYGVEKIDCVELVPGVVDAARWFPEMNRGVLDEPAYNLIRGDGRNHALVAREKYDVISIDATSPKMAGNGSLYTVEFYRLLRERLTADGLLVQWLPFHLLSDEETRMTARTFQAVFPHTTLWLSPLRHHGVLAGTIKPLQIDVQALRRRLELETTREELEPMLTAGLLDFLSWFVMGEDALAEYVGEGRFNTDDHPYLEFTPAMAFFTAGRYQLQNLARFQESRESVLPLLTNLGGTDEERAALAERVQKRYEATQYAIRGDIFYYLGRRADAQNEYTRALLADPESREWLTAMRLF